jgi:hypothetical protein
MQKVVGSNPIIRFSKAPETGLFLLRDWRRTGTTASECASVSQCARLDLSAPADDDSSLMGGRLLMAGTTRVVVIEKGGTPWWVPLVIGLAIAIAAAIASYVATWWFKKGEADRENASQAATLVDEAEKIVSLSGYRTDLSTGGPETATPLLQEARIRAEPLFDDDLDDRFIAALSYLSTFQERRKRPTGSHRWLRESVANVREGLVPYVAAPRLIPLRRRTFRKRSFPTLDELKAMKHDPNEEALMEALEAWEKDQP